MLYNWSLLLWLLLFQHPEETQVLISAEGQELRLHLERNQWVISVLFCPLVVVMLKWFLPLNQDIASVFVSSSSSSSSDIHKTPQHWFEQMLVVTYTFIRSIPLWVQWWGTREEKEHGGFRRQRLDTRSVRLGQTGSKIAPLPLTSYNLMERFLSSNNGDGDRKWAEYLSL